MEAFTTYLDVKTKSQNWCDKMQKVGLLTPEQFDQCISTFKDASSGTLPKEFKTPPTGLSHNYSLYNTNTHNELTSNITNENTNTIMLTTNNGATLACKPDNTIYIVSNINDPNINQKDLYFTLNPQSTDNTYAILSPYGHFLIANTDYTATFTGTSLGPSATWNITKIHTTNTTGLENSTILIGSFQYNDFHVIYDEASNMLKIVYGTNDDMQWTMNTKLQTTAESSNIIGAEYYVAKENIIHKIKTVYVRKICIQATLNSFKALNKQISDNFTNISNYLYNKLNNEQNLFRLSSLDYQTRIKSIADNSMLNDTVRASLVANIPKPSGMDITNEDITMVINNITNTKNEFLNNLQNNIINPLTTELNNLNTLTLDNEYDTYIQSLKTELDNVNDRIKQNNMIMSRQKDSYNKINNTYSQQLHEQENISNKDTITSINTEQLNKFNTQNVYLNKLYPIGILILALLCLYIGYITAIKFRETIWNKY